MKALHENNMDFLQMTNADRGYIYIKYRRK